MSAVSLDALYSGIVTRNNSPEFRVLKCGIS